MNLEKSIYIILYRMLWNKILQVELEGKIPTEARDADYSPLVFYHAEIDNKPLNDFLFFFPFDTRKTSEKFFYKKYRQAVTGTEEISIDYEILYNALHYLGYRLDHIEEKDYVEKWSVKNTKLLLTKFKADIADEDIPGRLITEPDTTPIYTEDIETIMLSIIKKMNKQKDSPKDFQTLLDAIRFEDDTENLIKRFAFLRNAYPDELPYLLRNGEMVAPYTIIHDYRKENLPGWGTYNFVEQFEPCSILKAGYEDAINRNKEALKKGNLPVVRVNDINQENNNLELTVQKAMYYDQVASSLEVDRELPIDRFPNNSEEIGTLRFWDMAQAGSEDKFPPFSKSILANTIGVAVAVYTLNENNQKVYVTRKRTDEEIMTYRDTEHLIFSFALKLDENNPVPKQGTIQDLIRSSYEKEEKSEIGLIINSFENVKPLALCREMIRGGKPQFFLEVKSKLSYEELKKHITEIPDEHDKEFLPEYLPNTLNGDLSFHKKSITPNEQLQKVIDFISTRKISSELFASLLLSFK